MCIELNPKRVPKQSGCTHDEHAVVSAQHRVETHLHDRAPRTGVDVPSPSGMDHHRALCVLVRSAVREPNPGPGTAGIDALFLCSIRMVADPDRTSDLDAIDVRGVQDREL